MNITTTDPFAGERERLETTFSILRFHGQQRQADRDALLKKLFKAQDQARDYLVNFPEDLEELTLKLAAEKDGFE